MRNNICLIEQPNKTWMINQCNKWLLANINKLRMSIKLMKRNVKWMKMLIWFSIIAWFLIAKIMIIKIIHWQILFFKIRFPIFYVTKSILTTPNSILIKAKYFWSFKTINRRLEGLDLKVIQNNLSLKKETKVLINGEKIKIINC